MHALIKGIVITTTTGVLLGLALSPAYAADTDTVDATVSAGTLSFAASAPDSMTSVMLDGISNKTSTGQAPQWKVVNARGTAAPWTLSASVTPFTSAAGSVDTVERELAANNLVITPGSVTAGTGSDAAPTTAPVTMSGTAQALVSSTSGKGTFTLTPVFDLTVPANAFRSNYAGDDGVTVNPYIATITFTIA
ncbi:MULTISPECIES: WxL domain-containing protein [Cryobacterium]|uniref:WxL domain surface cell wall-binding n=1 Tax=Cryobacterium levicorallinum TaxID=995038 RepID=A0A1I3CWB2_9MICO|nr:MULTISPECIES: WxL domain-containing protein [Cryobacterium]TFB78592.1 hypothetical protein E3O11_17060 [Cryobacterium levicorallinum]TFD55956.1 hypothetical protein E3T41_16660 [Cryobacterium sp. Hh38]SFH78696.1 WxL domain surface cell wall-binding [Cryobacterium levicorallinum]